VKYFEYMPILTSLIFFRAVALVVWQGALGNQLWLGVLFIGRFQFHPFTLMFTLSGITND